MAEIEKLNSTIASLKDDIESLIKNTLREELDAREIGGPGFAQSRDIMGKLDELLRLNNTVQQEMAKLKGKSNVMEGNDQELWEEVDDDDDDVLIIL